MRQRYIYFAIDRVHEIIKIGSSVNPAGRLIDLNAFLEHRNYARHAPMTIFAALRGGTKQECEILDGWKKYRLGGTFRRSKEWFRADPRLIKVALENSLNLSGLPGFCRHERPLMACVPCRWIEHWKGPKRKRAA